MLGLKLSHVSKRELLVSNRNSWYNSSKTKHSATIWASYGIHCTSLVSMSFSLVSCNSASQHFPPVAISQTIPWDIAVDRKCPLHDIQLSLQDTRLLAMPRVQKDMLKLWTQLYVQLYGKLVLVLEICVIIIIDFLFFFMLFTEAIDIGLGPMPMLRWWKVQKLQYIIYAAQIYTPMMQLEYMQSETPYISYQPSYSHETFDTKCKAWRCLLWKSHR